MKYAGGSCWANYIIGLWNSLNEYVWHDSFPRYLPIFLKEIKKSACILTCRKLRCLMSSAEFNLLLWFIILSFPFPTANSQLQFLLSLGNSILSLHFVNTSPGVHMSKLKTLLLYFCPNCSLCFHMNLQSSNFI